MKAENRIVFMAVAFGLLIYLADAVIDTLIFYEGTFWDLLILNVPAHEVYIRLVVILCFLIFGLIASRLAAARLLAEEALRLTQFSVDRGADPIYWMGPDARFVYVNEAAYRVLGYSQDELLSMTVHDINPDFPAEVWQELWEMLKRRGSITLESRHKTKDEKVFPVEITANYIKFGGREYSCAFAHDITERKQAERERERLISELQEALAKVKTLSGFIPICSSCKKIRDDEGYWKQVETYIAEHSEAEFSHGLCPDCSKKLYPDLYKNSNK